MSVPSGSKQEKVVPKQKCQTSKKQNEWLLLQTNIKNKAKCTNPISQQSYKETAAKKDGDWKCKADLSDQLIWILSGTIRVSIRIELVDTFCRMTKLIIKETGNVVSLFRQVLIQFKPAGYCNQISWIVRSLFMSAQAHPQRWGCYGPIQLDYFLSPLKGF